MSRQSPGQPPGQALGQRMSQVHAALGEIISELRQVEAVIAVAAGALRQQNADIDADIASVLRLSVGNPVQEQIAKLESARRLLSEGGPAGPRPPGPAARASSGRKRTPRVKN